MKTYAKPLTLSKEEKKQLRLWIENAKPREKIRGRAIELLDAKMSMEGVCDELGCCKESVHAWRSRYRIFGIEGLVDYRKDTNLAREALLLSDNGAMAPEIAKKLGMSEASAYRFVRMYHTYGLQGLRRPRHGRKKKAERVEAAPMPKQAEAQKVEEPGQHSKYRIKEHKGHVIIQREVPRPFAWFFKRKTKWVDVVRELAFRLSVAGAVERIKQMQAYEERMSRPPVYHDPKESSIGRPSGLPRKLITERNSCKDLGIEIIENTATGPKVCKTPELELHRSYLRTKTPVYHEPKTITERESSKKVVCLIRMPPHYTVKPRSWFLR